MVRQADRAFGMTGSDFRYQGLAQGAGSIMKSAVQLENYPGNHHWLPGSLDRHLGQEVPAEVQVGGGGRRDHGRHLPARRPGAVGRGGGGRPGALVRAVPLGAPAGRHSRGPDHFQRRRPGAQARHVHHQLHGVRHHRRLHAGHPHQGPRSRADAEGGLRHRLRILDPAAQGGLRLRRRGAHLGSDVLHGYLRQDVFHGVLGWWPARRPDGHLRRGPSRCARFHPRQAGRRPPPSVQSVPAGDRRVHAGRQAQPGLGAGLSAGRARGRAAGPGSGPTGTRCCGANGQPPRAMSPTTRGRWPAVSTRSCQPGACGT